MGKTFIEKLLKDLHFKSIDQVPQWIKTNEPVSDQIRALRNQLGMTQEQLAKRADQQPRLIRRLEADKETDPQLSTLAKTAAGLECELIVRFVPKKAIAKLLEERAQKKALEMIEHSKGSSAMEEQEPSKTLVHIQTNELVQELLKKPSLIWED